jgi:hypothetical protein
MRSNGFRYGSLLAAAVLTLGLVAAGCDDSSTSPAGSARLSLFLTDASGDVAEAWVNIGSIYLQGGAMGGSEEEGNGDSQGHAFGAVHRHSNGNGHMGNGRVWLREDPTGWIDLTTLSDDVEEIVDGAVIPSGTYKQLRFVIEEAVIVTEGGMAYVTPGADLEGLNLERGGDPLSEDGVLHCPGCDRSGLKVKCRDGIVASEEGETAVLTDFDVSQSFGRERGQSGRWVMHPMIRCSSMSHIGEVAGTVTLAEGIELPASCGNNDLSLRIFKPLAIDAEQEIWTGHTSMNGEFKIRPLAPGLYDLDYEPDIDFDDGSVVSFSASVDPSSVEVKAGGTAGADYMIESVGCTPGGGS